MFNHELKVQSYQFFSGLHKNSSDEDDHDFEESYDDEDTDEAEEDSIEGDLNLHQPVTPVKLGASFKKRKKKKKKNRKVKKLSMEETQYLKEH